MLKNIPHILSPELLHALMSMGHSDELVLGDGNYPAASHAQRLVRAEGISARFFVYSPLYSGGNSLLLALWALTGEDPVATAKGPDLTCRLTPDF